MESCEHGLRMRNSVFTYSIYTEIWCIFNAKLTLLTECCFFSRVFRICRFIYYIATVSTLTLLHILMTKIITEFDYGSLKFPMAPIFIKRCSPSKFGLTFFLEIFLIHRTLGCTHRFSNEQNIFLLFLFFRHEGTQEKVFWIHFLMNRQMTTVSQLRTNNILNIKKKHFYLERFPIHIKRNSTHCVIPWILYSYLTECFRKRSNYEYWECNKMNEIH